MFQALDKDKDGSISKAEAKGTPHDKDFATLDKDNDGKLSREEHAAAPEHAGDKAAAGGTSANKKY
jgi:Ca2+-binding EF-hand superfamily protein